MVSCTFLGHYDIIDLGFHNRLLQTLRELMDEDDEIQFFFYIFSPYQIECGVVVERLKKEFPNKAILRFWVGHDEIDEHVGRYHDCTINPSVELKTDSLCRWCIQESDYVVSNLYKELLTGRDNSLLELVQEHETPELIDITTDGTRKRMQEYAYRYLSERDLTIFLALFSGDDLKGIASKLGVSEQYLKGRMMEIRSIVMGHCRKEAAMSAPNWGPLPMHYWDKMGRPFSI